MENEITVKEHFQELRKRLLIIAVALVVLTAVGFGISKFALPSLIDYYGISAYSFTPAESLNIQLSSSLVFALILCLPLIVYQLYGFSKPAIKKINIKTYLISSTVLTLIAFVLGVTYFNKFLLGTLVSYSLFDQLTSVSSIMHLALTSAISLTVSFNMVVIIPLGKKAGLIEYSKAKKYIKHLLIASLIIGAVLTPPDIVSQLLVVVPLFVFSSTGIFITKFMGDEK